jgi:spore coat protein CotH
MTGRSLAITTSALMGLFLCAIPSTSLAQTADELFGAEAMQDVRLFVNTRDLELLRERYQEDTYYPADLMWGETRVRNVGIRSRGSASRNPGKLGLRVDFDRYVTDQTFVGLGAVVLDNLWQDPAMIRERTAMTLFARLGQPVPREVFCRLFINDVYQGVYALVEPIDKAFLKRTLDDDSGYLFEYQWLSSFTGQDPGDDLASYAALFEAETHESQAPAVLYTPLRDLFREVNAEDGDLWEERVGAYLDLPQFVTQVALDSCIADIDGLLGNWGMNNFYLYRSSGSTRHRPFPWDKDVAFDRFDHPILLHADENVIFQRAFEREDLRTLFFDVLERCARTSQEDDWLVTEIDRNAALIAEAAHKDPGKQFSNDDFDAGIEFLRDVARRRPAFLLQEIAAARRR